MTRVLVVGAGGTMGGHVLRAVDADPGMTVGAALDAPTHPSIGQEVAPGIELGCDLQSAVAGCDVAIDFSVPDSTFELLDAALPRGLPLVIATTGFTPEQQADLRGAGAKLAIVRAGNFSLGVTVLLDLVAEAARRLPDYQIEVLEMHHQRKVDAPSGTALDLARAAADARGVDLDEKAVYQREGHTGAREPDAIGIQSLRMGDVIGEHTVYLAGRGERVELSHRALSRENFAAGALRAAAWVRGQKAGLYSMRDVIA